jgi:hypothetical protein
MDKLYTLVVVESPYAPTTKIPDADCCCDNPKRFKPSDPWVLCAGHQCLMCGVLGMWFAERHCNIRYARAAMKDCLGRGEAPYLSHLLYTQEGVLDDTIPEEREHGIRAGFAWRQVAAKTIVYTDLGISKGMKYGIDDAASRGCPVEYRTLPGWVISRRAL